MLKRLISTAIMAAGLLAGSTTIASAAQPVERSGNVYHVAVCPYLVPNGYSRCHAHVVTDSAGHVLSKDAGPNTTPRLTAVPSHAMPLLRSSSVVTSAT